VRKVSPDGTITTVAGTGKPGFAGDGGKATAAQLDGPFSLVVDGAGDLFIAENPVPYGRSTYHRVRKVRPDGIITTVVGTGKAGFSGDGGKATDARLNTPSSLAVDTAGNLFVSDYNNYRVRKIDAVTGMITTVVVAARRRARAKRLAATGA
jgi:NHL repeat-containing protein